MPVFIDLNGLSGPVTCQNNSQRFLRVSSHSTAQSTANRAELASLCLAFTSQTLLHYSVYVVCMYSLHVTTVTTLREFDADI